MDFELPGPFPRKVTQDELEEIKALAMIKLGEFIEKELPTTPIGMGDELRFIYSVWCGTRKEREEAKKYVCGATSPEGGPPCQLDRGHNCLHSSVKRW